MEVITYIWVGVTGELRWKSRVISREIKTHAHALRVDSIPWWSFDASST